MSLINSTRDITRIGLKESTRYRAIVTRNDDPDERGRIKFKIPNFFEFDIRVSPWATPKNNDADGASSGAGVVNIPRVGSYVDIMFAGGSKYHPSYYPTSIFDTVKLGDIAKTNYPNRKIHQLQNGTYLIVDEKTNSVEIYDPGDFELKTGGICNLNVTGNISINSSKGKIQIMSQQGPIEINAKGGDVNVTTDGAANVVAQKDVTVQSKTGKINLIGKSGSKLGGIVTGNHKCNYNGQPHNACSLDVLST